MFETTGSNRFLKSKRQPESTTSTLDSSIGRQKLSSVLSDSDSDDDILSRFSQKKSSRVDGGPWRPPEDSVKTAIEESRRKENEDFLAGMKKEKTVKTAVSEEPSAEEIVFGKKRVEEAKQKEADKQKPFVPPSYAKKVIFDDKEKNDPLMKRQLITTMAAESSAPSYDAVDGTSLPIPQERRRRQYNGMSGVSPREEDDNPKSYLKRTEQSDTRDPFDTKRKDSLTTTNKLTSDIKRKDSTDMSLDTKRRDSLLSKQKDSSYLKRKDSLDTKSKDPLDTKRRDSLLSKHKDPLDTKQKDSPEDKPGRRASLLDFITGSTEDDINARKNKILADAREKSPRQTSTLSPRQSPEKSPRQNRSRSNISSNAPTASRSDLTGRDDTEFLSTFARRDLYSGVDDGKDDSDIELPGDSLRDRNLKTPAMTTAARERRHQRQGSQKSDDGLPTVASTTKDVRERNKDEISSVCEEMEKEPDTLKKEKARHRIEERKRQRELSNLSTEHKEDAEAIYKVTDAQEKTEDELDLTETQKRKKPPNSARPYQNVQPRIQTRPFSAKTSLSSTSGSEGMEAHECLDSTSIRESVYEQWYRARIREAKKKLIETKKKEEEEKQKKLKEENDHKAEREMVYKTWKEKKKGIIPDSVKKEKEAKEKEEKLRKENEEKKKDAEKTFATWKEKKEEVLKKAAREKRKKEKEEAEKKKELEDKKKEASSAFESWNKKKGETIVKEHSEVKKKEEEEREKRREIERKKDDEARKAYDEWESKKRTSLQKSFSNQDLSASRRPWRPSSAAGVRRLPVA